VKLSWLLPATDFDIYIHKGSLTGPEVARSAEGTTTAESAALDPSRDGTGVFVVHYVIAIGGPELVQYFSLKRSPSDGSE
jgi:hypothetical protein